MAFIGSAKKESNNFTVYHKDVFGTNTNSERFNFALKIDEISSDTAVALDSFARGFVNLTKDTYDDSKIFTSRNLIEGS